MQNFFRKIDVVILGVIALVSIGFAIVDFFDIFGEISPN